MRYIGTRLKVYVTSSRGMYSELAEKMGKYKKPRKNSKDDKYRVETLYDDDQNLELKTLSALMKETGKPIDFFIDFEPWEMPFSTGVSGNGNIVNSLVSSDLAERIEHLNEVIRLQNQLLTEKERVIALKDAEIEQRKKLHDDVIKLAQSTNSDKNRT